MPSTQFLFQDIAISNATYTYSPLHHAQRTICRHQSPRYSKRDKHQKKLHQIFPASTTGDICNFFFHARRRPSLPIYATPPWQIKFTASSFSARPRQASVITTLYHYIPSTRLYRLAIRKNVSASLAGAGIYAQDGRFSAFAKDGARYHCLHGRRCRHASRFLQGAVTESFITIHYWHIAPLASCRVGAAMTAATPASAYFAAEVPNIKHYYRWPCSPHNTIGTKAHSFTILPGRYTYSMGGWRGYYHHHVVAAVITPAFR